MSGEFIQRNTVERVIKTETDTVRETFVNTDSVERANEVEIRPEEQIETAKYCRKNLWNKIKLKGP